VRMTTTVGTSQRRGVSSVRETVCVCVCVRVCVCLLALPDLIHYPFVVQVCVRERERE